MESVFDVVISWYMRLVKPFKSSRPQFSHLSHGLVGLGELGAALTLMLCLGVCLGVEV